MGGPPGGPTGAKGKAPPPTGKGKGDGAKNLTYAERKALEVEQKKKAAEQAQRDSDSRVAELEAQGFEINTVAFLEEYLSGPADFQGRADAELTEQEYNVLRKFHTDQHEGPYAGDKFQPTRGYFACKGCGSIMYLHQSKFVHCQIWSSFDTCVKGANILTLEKDLRVDISCAKCKGHMGHIFDPDPGGRYKQRHCVNDSSIQYVKFDPPVGIEEEGVMVLPTQSKASVSEPAVNAVSMSASANARYFINGKLVDSTLMR